MKRVMFFAMLIGAISFSACNSDNEATLKIRLTDAPADYDAVNIDIQGLEVLFSESGDSKIEGVETAMDLAKPGVYNLLEFNNGLDMLLAESEFKTGTLSQIRLILGNNNTVVKDGETFALTTPSAQQSGLKLKVNQKLEEGITYNMWLDFDAARSIVTTGSNKYILKPTIRVFTEATSGAVKGSISPTVAAHLMLIAGTDTLGTIAADGGNFLFKGVAAGTYKFVAEATGYQKLEKADVVVVNGATKDLGVVTLTAVK